jgi:hypothetical protein
MVVTKVDNIAKAANFREQDRAIYKNPSPYHSKTCSNNQLQAPARMSRFKARSLYPSMQVSASVEKICTQIPSHVAGVQETFYKFLDSADVNKGLSGWHCMCN